jgi:two-component system, chemotaxis family, chemotaxis protein CheY
MVKVHSVSRAGGSELRADGSRREPPSSSEADELERHAPMRHRAEPGNYGFSNAEAAKAANSSSTGCKPFRGIGIGTKCLKRRKAVVDLSYPVLVVDDFHTMSAIISRLVRDVGFTDIDQVSDGPSALDQLHEKKYGLIISDWDMRPMNGTDLIQRIRDDPMHERTPIIMVTAVGRTDGSWQSGANGYLNKPFKTPELRAKIEEVMLQRAGQA